MTEGSMCIIAAWDKDASGDSSYAQAPLSGYRPHRKTARRRPH